MAQLPVTDLKALLARHGEMPKPAPRRRIDLVPLVRLRVAASEWMQLATQRARERFTPTTIEDIEIAKCKLLAHTISMRAYALPDHYEAERLAQNGWRELSNRVALPSTDLIESEVVERFNAGKLNGIPPFFPGDRTCLVSPAALSAVSPEPPRDTG